MKNQIGGRLVTMRRIIAMLTTMVGLVAGADETSSLPVPGIWFRADDAVTNESGLVVSIANRGAESSLVLEPTKTAAEGLNIYLRSSPSLFGGRPYLDFGGTGNLKSTASTSLGFPTDSALGGMTWFAVFRTPSAVAGSGNYGLFGLEQAAGSTSGSERFAVFLAANNREVLYCNTFVTGSGLGDGIAIKPVGRGLEIASATYDWQSSPTAAGYLYGKTSSGFSQSIAGHTAGRAWSGSFHLGLTGIVGTSAAWTTDLTGELAEIRIYNRALSNSERASVEHELAVRYGLESEVDPPPDTPHPNLRIAHIADPQIGFITSGIASRSEANFERNYAEDLKYVKAMIPIVNAQQPDVVFIAGDLMQNAEDLDKVWPELLTQFEAPVIVAPGNHDMGNNVTAANLARFREVVGYAWTSVSIKGYRLIVMNSQFWYATDGSTAANNAKAEHDTWFNAQIAAAVAAGEKIILCSHIPPFENTVGEADSYFNCPQSKRTTLMNMLLDNGVDYWLCGHTHTKTQHQYTNANGTLNIWTSEAVCENFDGTPRGFQLFEIPAGETTATWSFVPVTLPVPANPLTDFELLEYVTASGSQYINTGYVPNQDTEIWVRYAVTESTKSRMLFGCAKTQDTYPLLRAMCRKSQDAPNDGLCFIDMSSSSGGENINAPKGTPDATVHELFASNARKTFDGQALATATKPLNGSVGSELWLMKGNKLTGGEYFIGNFYGCRISEKGVWKQYLVPARRISTGEVGMLDLMSNELLLPASGTLTAGEVLEQSISVLLLKGITATDPLTAKINYCLQVGDGTAEVALVWRGANGTVQTNVLERGVTGLVSREVSFDGFRTSADLSEECTVTASLLATATDGTTVETESKELTLAAEAVSGGLPEGYEELTYVRSTGNQYFVTDYIPNGDTRIDFKFAATDTDLNLMLFGVYGSGNQCLRAMRRRKGADAAARDGVYFIQMTDTLDSDHLINSPAGTADTTDHELVAANNEKTLDGVALSGEETVPLTKSVGKTLWLLRFNNHPNYSNLYNFRGLLYGCKITEGETVVRDYVPAKAANGDIGLYDRAGNTFKTASGADFTGGEVVPPQATMVVTGGTVSSRDTQLTFSSAVTSGNKIYAAYGNTYGGDELANWEHTTIDTGLVAASAFEDRTVKLTGVTAKTATYVRLYTLGENGKRVWSNTYAVKLLPRRRGGLVIIFKGIGQ